MTFLDVNGKQWIPCDESPTHKKRCASCLWMRYDEDETVDSEDDNETSVVIRMKIL